MRLDKCGVVRRPQYLQCTPISVALQTPSIALHEWLLYLPSVVRSSCAVHSRCAALCNRTRSTLSSHTASASRSTFTILATDTGFNASASSSSPTHAFPTPHTAFGTCSTPYWTTSASEGLRVTRAQKANPYHPPHPTRPSQLRLQHLPTPLFRAVADYSKQFWHAPHFGGHR
ncbi:hypothetical protein B0H11DRAFT_2070825 [Mycena galericulata]|nr:hypothetical protein B0H11DRAFT_2070819 [Mycena galericulata]KAJ7453720.1 hypothetical protein B0H11DRAFT_2070825 [Mycena galericulata]